MNNYKIELDEANHIYTVNGIAKSSVTQILKAEGIINDSYYQEWNRDLGIAVHKACEYWDNGTLDIESIDDVTKKRLNNWKQFMSFYPQSKILHNEEKLYCKQYDYCGTLDRCMKIITGDIRRDGIILIDIKTCQAVPKWAGLQLMAYKLAFESMFNLKIKERWVVQLREDTYKVIPYANGIGDKRDWLSIVNTFNLKKRMGIYG